MVDALHSSVIGAECEDGLGGSGFGLGLSDEPRPCLRENLGCDSRQRKNRYLSMGCLVRSLAKSPGIDRSSRRPSQPPESCLLRGSNVVKYWRKETRSSRGQPRASTPAPSTLMGVEESDGAGIHFVENDKTSDKTSVSLEDSEGQIWFLDESRAESGD